MKRFVLVLMVLLLFGCSDPKNTIIPKDVDSWDKELKSSVEKLSD